MPRRNQPFNDLPDLPPAASFDSAAIQKRLLAASRPLAELNGYLRTLPSPHLLLSAAILKEAQASSEIENIVTTQDELYTALADGFTPRRPGSCRSSRSSPRWNATSMRKAKRILSSDSR